MVAAIVRMARRARLFHGRRRKWRTLLDLSRRRRCRPRDRIASLVPAWNLLMTYSELQVTTHFSFLRGASSPDELFARAKAMGMAALGITDRNSLAGIVRALEASRATGLRLVVGCRLDLQDGMSILVYPTDKAAYSRLTRLITLGKGRGGKNNCILHWDDVMTYAEGMIGIFVPDMPDDLCAVHLRRMKDT